MAADGTVKILIQADGKEAIGSLDDLKAQIEGFNVPTKKANGILGTFREKLSMGAIIGIATKGIDMLTGGIGSLFSEAMNASDAMDKFKSTMNFAGFNKKEIKAASKDMKKYADDTVYELSDVMNTTAQLAANGVKDYKGLTKAAGNLNAVAGGSANSFKAVAMVLTQTAGAGKLTTENWNQLTDAIPGASGKLQDAMRKNGAFTGNFRDAMEKGQISADEFNKAIQQLGMTDVAKKAAKSSETFEGAMGQLRSAGVDAFVKIYNAIGKENITNAINGITDFVVKSIPKITDTIKGVVDYVQKNKGWIEPLAKGLLIALPAISVGTKLFKIFGPVVKIAGKAFGSLGGALGGIGGKLFGMTKPLGDANEKVKKMNPSSKTFAKNMIAVGLALLEAGAGLGLAAAGFSLLVGSIKELATTGDAGIKALIGVSVAVAGLVAVFALFGKMLTAGAVGMAVFGATMLAIGASVLMVATGITMVVNAFIALTAVSTQIVPTLTAIGVGFASMIAGFITTIIAAMPQIVVAIGQLVLTIATTVATLVPKLAVIGIDMIVSLINAIASKIEDVIAAGINLIRQFIMGMVKAIPELADIAYDAVMEFVYGVGYVIGKVLTSGSDLIAKFIAGITSGITGSKSAGKKNGNAVKGVLEGFNLFSIGKNLISGLIDGVVSMANSLAKKAKKVVSDAVEGVKNFLGIHSPSKLFYGIGEFTGQGLINGIDSMANEVSKASVGMAKAAVVDPINIPLAYSSSFGAISPEKISGLGTGGKLSTGIINSYSTIAVASGQSNTTPTVLEAKFDIDGQNFVRATAPLMQKTIEEQKLYTNRRRGILPS